LPNKSRKSSPTISNIDNLHAARKLFYASDGTFQTLKAERIITFHTKHNQKRKIALPTKAILLDYIGTLVEPRNYTLQDSKTKLYEALCEAGLVTNREQFMEAYTKAHEKYRLIRYQQLKEVTNAIWVSETLNAVGCKTTVHDAKLKAALNVFFQDFIDSLKLRPHAKQLIKNASERCKIGLVSNFTYAPVIYTSLRKLGISRFFSAIVVSEAVSWRKPHRIIFENALRILRVKPEDAVFIGDSPLEDMNGAKSAGLRSIFVASCFNSLREVEKCSFKPDLVCRDLKEVCEKLPQIVNIA
jgi:HAD superfamily hydrolase (TIGR01509 family)